MAKKANRISGITVRGFKSIWAEQHIDIKPLTILAGANSSGKSSLMQPLLLLKQTLDAPADPGVLLLDGENVRFTTAKQLLSSAPGKGRRRGFALRISLLDNSSLELVFRWKTKEGLDLAEMTYRAEKELVVVTPRMTHDEILEVLPDFWKDILRLTTKKGEDVKWTVARERCLFLFELAQAEQTQTAKRLVSVRISPSDAFVPLMKGVIHLPGLRGNPQRTYGKTAAGPTFPGIFQSYVASVISQWQGNAGRSRLALLAHALEDMGLTWKVKAKPIDDTQVELMVGRLPHRKKGGASDLVNIADVGFGVSQSLPVIVALLAAGPGQLVYLEQPEIHLHPLAQRRLASVLCGAVKRDVVAVVETHSALLLREVLTLIAKGEVRKEDVALHWFQRSEEGETTVRTAQLDDTGAYGDWPEDFDEVELEAEKAYLDAVEARKAQK